MAVSKFCNAFEALRDGWSGAAPGAGEAAVLLICSVIYCIYSFILYLVRLEERSMQHPEIDYKKIGMRIRAARLEKGYSQADLGALVGCSNNHMSHVEVGQTKVSLPMLLKISYALDKDIDFFISDTPYAKCDYIINSEISDKLSKCSAGTLITVNRILDALLDQQAMFNKDESALLVSSA